MKTSFPTLIPKLRLPFVAVAMAAFSFACFAQCSQETIRGTWAHYSLEDIQWTLGLPAGAPPMPVKLAALALADVDHQGRFSQTFTAVANGTPHTGTSRGTISVNPDCIAVLTYASGDGQRLIIMNNGSEMRGINTSRGFGPSTGPVTWRRVSRSEPNCATHMVRGVYAVIENGYYLSTPPGQSSPLAVPFSAIGALTVNYSGKGTGAGTMSMGGTVLGLTIPEMSIAVNEDCTGDTAFKNQIPGVGAGTGTGKIIVLENGDEFIGLMTQISGGLPAWFCVGKRIAMMPVPPVW